jgi:hypothetical protein
MAEIRINATGGVKLYDADDSHYAQIIAGTITSNVDALTLGSSSATFNIPVTVGVNDTGHDVKFFGATASAYMLWDESADDLILAGAAGLSVAGATATAAITASGIVKTDDTTEATSTTDGSLQTDGGLSVAKDTVMGDDLKLLSDSSVIAFGADGEVTLTHVHNDGLLLNSDNQLQFRDSAINIRSDADGDLDINADDEIELNSTLIDINGNVEISGTATTTGVHTFSATPVFPDGSIALADLDIDGGTDIGADLVDADEIIVDDGGGGTNRRCDVSRLKTYIGGGITMADSWRMTNNQTVSTGNEDLSDDGGAAWARVNSDGYGVLGSALTEDGTAGVFSFPATGMYYITASAIMQKNGSSRYNDLNIMTTGDNSTYGIASTGRGFVIQTDSDTTISELFTDFILDVSNTTNVKFKLNVLVASGDIAIIGDSATIFSGFTVIRLGDT